MCGLFYHAPVHLLCTCVPVHLRACAPVHLRACQYALLVVLSGNIAAFCSCGTGLCAVALKGRFDSITGVDLSPEMAGKARSKGMCVFRGVPLVLPERVACLCCLS